MTFPRRLLALLVALVLWMPASASAEPPTISTPQPESVSDCAWLFSIIVGAGQGWYWQFEDTEQRAEFFAVCRQVAPYFTESWAALLGSPGKGGIAQQLHAMATVQCESGLDNMANFRRWGDGTRGIWAFMRYLRWPQRLGFPWLDMYDNGDASFLASVMVFTPVNPKVSEPNWYWWWSCHRSMNRVLRVFGIRQVWHCPTDAAYWARVPPGSNRVCGGVSY